MRSPLVRPAAWFVGVLGLCACAHVRPSPHTGTELGCGAGGYASQPLMLRRATLPEPTLVGVHASGLRVAAYDADNGAPISNLRLQLTSAADSVTRQTTFHGDAVFAQVAAGMARLDARMFNFLPSRDSIRLRAGFIDTVELRLGRMGKECFIVPHRSGVAVGRA